MVNAVENMREAQGAMGSFEFENGYWALYARKRGTSVRGAAKVIANGHGAQARQVDSLRSSVYRWLNGDDARLGRGRQQALAKAFGISLRTLLRERAAYLAGKRGKR